MHKALKPKRVLLKLSGEALLGEKALGIDAKRCMELAGVIHNMQKGGLEIGLVIGGGNIFRGAALKEIGIEATPADHIGLLSTIMNGIALERALVARGTKVRVMSALSCPSIVETYDWRRSQELISQGTLVIFVGGTGNPFFTTDSAAALRASELKVDLLLKATKVDGVYSKDPLKDKDAVLFETVTYGQILAEKLEVMDSTAIALCRNNHIPIFVFNMTKLFLKPLETILQERQGTLVSGE